MRELTTRLIISILLVLLPGCGSGPSTPIIADPTQISPTDQPMPTSASSGPDIIFTNADVITMNDSQPGAQALAIEGDRILHLGSNEEIVDLRTTHTRVIDLGGRTIMPGFVDAHTHLLNDAGTFDMNLDSIQQLALENGITSFANMFTTPEFLAEMQNYGAQGRLRTRVSLYLNYNTNCGEMIGNWWKSVAPTREPGEMLRIGGVKIFADGGSCNRPALSFETTPGSGLGDLFLTSEQITDVVREAQSVGHQVAIHALGDRAIEAALDGIESALDGNPNTHRHRIEHNAILRPDLLPRYGEIGVVATIFATFPSCTPFDSPSPEPYNQWEWAWPTLIEANPNLHMAWHGDDPYIRPVSPILELYGFITRRQAEDDRTTVCDAPAWIRDDTLTVEQALPMMTRESAYALFRDDEVGTLEPGKFADLIILSANPVTDNPETLLDTRVLMTMVGANVEFCEAGFESLCPASSVTPPEPIHNPITASSFSIEFPPSNAFDGNLETLWNAGAGPDQWIQIDLGQPTIVSAIRLIIAQSPEGETRHQIWGGVEANNLILLHEFMGFTQESGTLEFHPPTPLTNIQIIKIVTTQTPSWVAWREIEVIEP